LFGELEGDAGFVVADLEAGTGTVLRMQPGMADVVVVVAQPTLKSIDIAARAARTARNRAERIVLVANRVTSDDDVAMIRDAVDHDELVAVADDAGIAAADRAGEAPIDVAPEGAGVEAIVALARRLAA
jgi:CO dehydrogenase nickel-insertion accessory protein CooC1